jgi:hypothetical protein
MSYARAPSGLVHSGSGTSSTSQSARSGTPSHTDHWAVSFARTASVMYQIANERVASLWQPITRPPHGRSGNRLSVEAVSVFSWSAGRVALTVEASGEL